MAILVISLLVLLSLVLFSSKRSRETGLILAMTLALALHWMSVLVYIAKKGGIGQDMQIMLFGTKAIRHNLQYLLLSLKQLGYAMAVGRYLFPLILVLLALQYSYDPRICRRRALRPLACILPVLTLIIYLPPVFETLIAWHRMMLIILVKATLVWIALYLLAALALLLHEYRQIGIPFYRREFRRKCTMVISLSLLYAVYYPQDPAQVYLFYRNEYMGAVQGLWYLNPALNLGNYMLVFAAVLICFALGFRSLMLYAQENFRQEHEDVAIQRKFDAASKGVSVFVHSVKNQLLANRILLRRLDAELKKESPDLGRVQDYQRSLSQSNEAMLLRMEELYQSVKKNSITLVPHALESVCLAAKERFARKYPAASLEITGCEGVQILCDRVHMAEAIYNLLTNGWEAHMAAGREDKPIRICCRQERMWTVIDVTDCGDGISASQRMQIFDPFYSSKNTNTNWGMGLYYVRAIVRSHLGVLRLESSIGRGSSFIIQLPRYDGGR